MNKYLLKKMLFVGVPVLAVAGGSVALVLVLTDGKSSGGNEYGLSIDQEHAQDSQTDQTQEQGTQQNHEEIPQQSGQNTPPPGTTQNQLPGYSSSLSRFDIFPQLNAYDFYDYIRVNENGPYFTDDFIAAVVNKVIKDSIITDGTIHFSYERVSQSVLKITFVWVRSNGDTYPKVYTFTLTNSTR